MVKVKTPRIFSAKHKAIEDAKKTVLAVVVVASIIVSVSLVALNFLYDLSRYKAKVISEKEGVVETINDNLAAVSDLVTSFQAFENGPDLIPSQDDKKNSSIILDSLPSKYDFPALATSVESLVQKNGLIMDAFSGQDESSSAVQSAAEPLPVEIPFNLVVIGPYEDIQKFIEKLQNTIQPMNVDRLKLTGSDQSIRAEIAIRTFYQPSVSLDVETKAVTND